MSQEMAERLESQMQLIEALLGDKQQMSAQIEMLLKQNQELKKELQKQKRVVEERFSVDMRRWKDVFLASEKVKRQKWEQEKIAEIKAVTIKGLEPELQRLVERQKEDSRLQALQHEDELAQLRLSLTQEHYTVLQ